MFMQCDGFKTILGGEGRQNGIYVCEWEGEEDVGETRVRAGSEQVENSFSCDVW